MHYFFPFDGPEKGAVFFVAFLAIYLVILVWKNRHPTGAANVQNVNCPKNIPAQLPQTICVSCWNIGYAGLGKDSDFVTDGGKNWFPPSRNQVRRNLAGIQDLLTKPPLSGAHMLMLQEVSKNSPLSFWVRVRHSLKMTLREFCILYHPDIATWGVPWPIKISHGTLSACRSRPINSQIVHLPVEPSYLGGVIKRKYALLVTRFAIENSSACWVLVNLHLAAFDPKGATRFKQLDAVMAFAQSEYEKGNFVILGGDWNMALTPSDFPHTTDMSKLFWLVTLPKNQIPKNWRMATDARTASVRTNYQPYVKNQNYTAIIDGFIVSPNVQIDDIITIDTGFTHTDHQPVNATFSAMISR